MRPHLSGSGSSRPPEPHPDSASAVSRREAGNGFLARGRKLLVAVVIMSVAPLVMAGIAPGLDVYPAPSPQTSTAATVEPTTDDPEPLVRVWLADADGGAGVVREALGGAGNADVEVGTPLQLSTWAPGFLDGTEPGAAPVTGDTWAAPVRVDGDLAGVLVAGVEEGSASGTYLEDRGVGGTVDEGPGDDAVLDRPALAPEPQDAGDQAEAVGATAQQLLAGPVDLATLSQVLRERRGLVGSAAPGVTQDTDSGMGHTLPLWIPLIAVLIVVAVVVLLTVRHERRVLRPLTATPASPDEPGAPSAD